MAGWANATKTILEAQQRALQALLPAARGRDASLPATSGDKPGQAPRRRGRPPKSAGATGRPRRGRPPKSARTKR